MTTELHTLIDVILDNWSAIAIVISVISFAITMTKKFTNFTHDLKDREAEQNRQIQKNHEQLSGEVEALRHVQQEFATEVAIQYDNVLSKIKDQERKREDGSERTRIIMDGVEATLEAMHAQGHNGPVTSALGDIKEYKSKVSAKD